MTLDLDLDVAELRREIEHWSGEFGETSEQALYRLAARTGAWCAVQTDPVGKDTRQRQERAVWKGIRQACLVLPKKVWTFTRKMKEPRVRYQQGGYAYFRVHRNQFEMDAAEVNRRIDAMRGGSAGPGRRGVLQKVIIPDTTLKKLTTGRGADNRLNRAGLAKGAWIGAAQEVQAWVDWDETRPVGKNWLGWTHKWAHKGSATRSTAGGNLWVTLHNSAPYIHRIFDDMAAERAMRNAWEATLAWYKAAVAALDRKE